MLVKALISLDPGEEMEFLKKQFQEFISGLMSLPINIPGSRLYKSLQASKTLDVYMTLWFRFLISDNQSFSRKNPKEEGSLIFFFF